MDSTSLQTETKKQRWDRNFADLLQELRVAQSGVWILYAFLPLSMAASVLLITDYLLHLRAALILTSITAAFFLTFWEAVP